MNNKMTHQNTLLTQTQMCPKGFDDEHAKLVMTLKKICQIQMVGWI